jgi:aminomethyltransferase
MASPRQSVLASRHRALGSQLGDWNSMDVPWSYAQDVNDEHYAVRNTAGLFDVSGLRKILVSGPDAMAVLNHVCTRDLTRAYPGKSAQSVICNDDGGYTDDCIMYHIAPDVWMMVHGSGSAMDQLRKSAVGKNVQIMLDDDLHIISLQGPQAVYFLNEHTLFDLMPLKYFHHVPTRLFERHCLISRTGFSGERGYEIFAKGADIVHIWDNILAKGKAVGILPCSFNCLDLIRVESGLYFFPYDMTEENDAWECGLDFAVSLNKQADYRGKAALMARRGKEKMKLYGIIANTDKAMESGAEIYIDGRKAGKITQGMYSTLMKKSLAIAQLDPQYAKDGIKLEVSGTKLKCSATTHALPFDDPERKKFTA